MAQKLFPSVRKRGAKDGQTTGLCAGGTMCVGHSAMVVLLAPPPHTRTPPNPPTHLHPGPLQAADPVQAIAAGRLASRVVSAAFPPPMELKFERVCQPFMLLHVNRCLPRRSGSCPLQAAAAAARQSFAGVAPSPFCQC
jgi:hypothetical protein